MDPGPSKLNTIEREAVEILEKFYTVWVHDLLKYKGNQDKLVNYLGIMTLIRPFYSFIFIWILT